MIKKFSTDAMQMVPGEISDRVAKQFLHRYKRSDPRCNTDETYCETNKVSCMVNKDLLSYALQIKIKALVLHKKNNLRILLIYDEITKKYICVFNIFSMNILKHFSKFAALIKKLVSLPISKTKRTKETLTIHIIMYKYTSHIIQLAQNV